MTQITGCQGKGQEPRPHGDLGNLTSQESQGFIFKELLAARGCGAGECRGVWLPLEQILSLPQVGPVSGANHQ